MITIKKYPNRRLYDTSQSQYINLETIRDLVMSHKEFRVIDSKTEDDLTKSILLQIITEQENNDQQSVLTQSVLKQLIRFYGSDMQVFLRQYLEQSIATFLEQHETMQGMMKGMMDASPLNVFNQLMEKNMSMWNNFTGMDPSKFTMQPPTAAGFTPPQPSADNAPDADSSDNGDDTAKGN